MYQEEMEFTQVGEKDRERAKMWYLEDYADFVARCEALTKKVEEYSRNSTTNKKVEKDILLSLAKNQLDLARLMAIQVGAWTN